MALNNHQIDEIAAGSILVAIASVAVILRFVAKVTRKLVIGLDDWLSLASLVLILGLLLELLLWPTIGGNGRHIYELAPEEITNFFKIFYANELTYILCSPCIKLCILAFYHKVFSIPRFKRLVKIIAVFIILFSFSFEMAAIFQCTPIAAAWNKMLLMKPGAHCFDGNTYFLAYQCINIFLDLSILILPLPIIWNLNRSWQDKLALTGVFVLGGFACAASIYRIVTLFYIDNNDITYTIYQATVWTFVEPCIGLLCACLPIIRGLLPAWKAVGARAVRRGSKFCRQDYAGSRQSDQRTDPKRHHEMDDTQTWASADGQDTSSNSTRELIGLVKADQRRDGEIYVTTTISHDR